MAETDPAQQDAATENDWPPWADPFLDALRLLPNLSRAAKAVGVARTTPWRLAQRDEAFALAVNDARDEALDTLEQEIFVRATVGKPMTRTTTRTTADGTVETTVVEERHVSDTLAMFFLKRWRPEYREAYRVEQTGPAGGPVRVRVERERTPERLEELLRVAAEVAGYELVSPDNGA